jgi:hypothetical protein
MPVRQFGSQVVANCPGPITRLLWQALLDEMEQHAVAPSS